MTTIKKNAGLKAVLPGAGSEQLESIMKAGQEAASRQIESTMSATAEQLEKLSQQMLKTTDELAVLSKGNMDAAVKCSTIIARGMEEISKIMMGLTQAAIEQGITTSKAMLGVKTMRELVDLQSEYMRSNLDQAIAEGSKISEISARVSTEIAEPINSRMAALAEKIAQPTKAA